MTNRSTLQEVLRSCCWAAALVILMILGQGCSGTAGGDGTAGGGDEIRSASDCGSTDADAIVSVDNDEDTALLALAVTSDCDELAVYEDDGRVSQVGVALSDGSQVIAEFNEDGRVVAVRSEDDTLSVSYNDGLGFARAEFTDGSGSSTASVFAVDRDTTASRRFSGSQTDGETLMFCDELDQFAELLAAGCDGDSEQPFCDTKFELAGGAAEGLCQGGNVQQVQRLEDTAFNHDKQPFPLGVDGFVTARPAANGATTFVCAAEAFGGRGPFQLNWELIDMPAGASAPGTSLPGGAAIFDATTNTGAYEFQVTVTDATDATASDGIRFDLGTSAFFGANIVFTPQNPEPGQSISFKAVLQNDTESSMEAGQQAPEPGAIFWQFGDGSNAAGRTASHTFGEPGVYEVALVVVAAVECDYTDVVRVVVGDGGDAADDALDFKVEITASTTSMAIGDVIQLTPQPSGGIRPINYGWGIINEDGKLIAQLSAAAPALSAQSVLGEIASLQAIGEGIVLVGLLAADSAGRTAIDTLPIGIFGDGGGLFAVIEEPLFLEAGAIGTLKAAVIGAQGTLSYNWFVQDDPFSTVDDGAQLVNPKAAAPQISAQQPGFLGIGLRVSDPSGNIAEAFGGLQILAQGFGDLIVQFLGPFEVPVAEDAPLHAFIEGGVEPYFCSWNLQHGDVDATFRDPFSCRQNVVFFPQPGCAEVELKVEDVAGALGSAFFTLCGGDGIRFGCPFDGFCDPACPDFDPDCDDPCPLDGQCNDDCPLFDPDCCEDCQFCVPGDGFCDRFCADFGPPDADCGHCPQDGVCVFGCPEHQDPDCNRDFCLPGDGMCDFGCFPPDPDCADGFCMPGDGMCHLGCPQPDPDCGGSNDQICAIHFFCCPGDAFCDIGDCPEPDSDCVHCVPDGVCVQACHVPDSDCQFDGCTNDAQCNDFEPCTVDRCESSSFGNFCHYEFLPNCQPGSCQDDLQCDDSDPCTIDHCITDAAGSGFCAYAFVPDCQPDGCQQDFQCDDLDPCTVDFCALDGVGTFCIHDVLPDCGPNGACQGDIDCDDFDACTVDHCMTAAGGSVCVHDPLANCQPGDGCQTPAECDDFDPCTLDHCLLDAAGSGTCMHDPNCMDQPCVAAADCDDFDPCSDDLCVGGICQHTAQPGCDPAGGCVTAADCDDAQPCTAGTCVAGLCQYVSDPNCFCGDGACVGGEDCQVCPADCGPCANGGCGNAACDAGEDCAICPSDCGPCGGFCGDGICDGGEECIGCAPDCGPCPGTCGNATCDAGENNANCPSDCP